MDWLNPSWLVFRFDFIPLACGCCTNFTRERRHALASPCISAEIVSDRDHPRDDDSVWISDGDACGSSFREHVLHASSLARSSGAIDQFLEHNPATHPERLLLQSIIPSQTTHPPHPFTIPGGISPCGLSLGPAFTPGTTSLGLTARYLVSSASLSGATSSTTPLILSLNPSNSLSARLRSEGVGSAIRILACRR